MFELRDYQQQAVDKGVDFLKNSKKGNGIIVIPTGGGKSLVIANIAKQLDGNVVVFQPSKELLEQNFQKFISYGGYASIFSASKGQKMVSKVTYATIGTAVSKTEMFQKTKYVIVDESHLVSPNSSSMYQQFFNDVKCRVIGLTATPVRMKQYNFPEKHSKIVMLTRMKPRFFTSYLHITQIKELEERGYFAKTKYVSFDFDKSTLRVNTTGADYTEASIKDSFIKQDILGKVKSTYQSALSKGRKHILIFVPSVAEAEHLSDMHGVAYVSGQTKKAEREHILAAFKAGKIKAVANVGVLTTGFDFPELDTIIGARPTMSLALYYQMLGRGVRPHPSKEDCLIVDLVGNYNKFGRVEDLEIKDEGGWGIYTGNKLLTGVEMEFLDSDFTDDQEKSMPFGKYKGFPLSNVPDSYFEWMYENVTKTPKNAFLFEHIEKNILKSA